MIKWTFTLTLIILLQGPIIFQVAEATSAKEVSADVILYKIAQGEPIDYPEYNITGDFDLYKINDILINKKLKETKEDLYSKSCQVIESPISITNCRILGPINFSYSFFNNSVNFSGTEFIKSAKFTGSNFSDASIFYKCTFQEKADFSNAFFRQKAEFNDIKNINTTLFINSIFNDDAEFYHSKYEGDIQFNKAKFNRSADFSSSIFNNFVSFRETRFLDSAGFQDSIFNDATNFDNSTFHGNVKVINSTFNGTSSFTGSDFIGNGNFIGTTFNKDVNFQKAVFNNDANFVDMKFNNIVYFNKALFEDANFEDSIFKDDAIFHDASINGDLSLDRTKYNKIYIRWNNISKLRYNTESYTMLIENFRKIGSNDDANECFYQYHKALREYEYLHNDFRSCLLYIENILLDWTYGFGVKPHHTVITSFIIIIIFAFSFWILSSGITGNNSKIIESICFSAKAFLSGTKLFINPPKSSEFTGSSYKEHMLLKNLLLIERSLGGILFFLFILAVTNVFIKL